MTHQITPANPDQTPGEMLAYGMAAAEQLATYITSLEERATDIQRHLENFYGDGLTPEDQAVRVGRSQAEARSLVTEAQIAAKVLARITDRLSIATKQISDAETFGG